MWPLALVLSCGIQSNLYDSFAFAAMQSNLYDFAAMQSNLYDTIFIYKLPINHLLCTIGRVVCAKTRPEDVPSACARSRFGLPASPSQ